MRIYTLRATHLRFAAMLAVSVTLIAALILLIPTYPATTVFAADGTAVYTGAKTNDGRVDFLRRFGWEVKSNPVETVGVTIPAEFDRIFSGYNDLQKLQGLDLSRYRRKNVTRYVYEVTNYPDYDGTVYATLLVYRGKVVGGDLCSAEADGFIHGFTKSVSLEGNAS